MVTDILGPDGMPLTAPVTAAVTVTRIESCASASCPGGATTGSQAILTSTAQEQYALLLLVPDLPTELVKVGDAFDLVVDAARIQIPFFTTVNQTVVLARAGKLVLFVASLSAYGLPRVPNLDAYGIAVTDDGAECQAAVSGGCIPRNHRAGVTLGTDSGVASSGQTVHVGSLSFSSGSFLELADTGFCDATGTTVMAGFMMP